MIQPALALAETWPLSLDRQPLPLRPRVCVVCAVCALCVGIFLLTYYFVLHNWFLKYENNSILPAHTAHTAHICMFFVQL